MNDTEQIFLVNTSSSQPPAGVSKIEQASVAATDIADFSTVCRTCATVTEFVIPIFEGEGVQNNLAEKIAKHLPIQVSEQDVLPRVVCYQCASTLLAWHELVQCCVQADAALRARLVRSDVQNSKPDTTKNVTNSSGEQQQKWKTCPIKFKPCAWDRGKCSQNQYTSGEYGHDVDDHFDIDRSPDEDDEPLSTIASKKSIDLYNNFYKALVNFKNHFVREHHSDDTSSDTSESDDSEIFVNEPNNADSKIEQYDDLSSCNMRKDRMDEDMRLELSKVQTKINGKTVYTCPTCGKNLSSSHTYMFHKRIHTGERPCVCHMCGKQFRTPNALQRHLTETHERARRHACRLCLKSFANSQNLKQHMRIHTGERPFVCVHCGKRFAQSGSLHTHAKTHSGHLPHECTECGAKFRLRSSLARHKLRHSGVRAHVCELCGRSFRLRHELTAHVRAHDGSRPYACAVCGATFRQRRALRHHAKRLHGQEALPRDLPQPLLPGYVQLGNY